VGNEPNKRKKKLSREEGLRKPGPPTGATKGNAVKRSQESQPHEQTKTEVTRKQRFAEDPTIKGDSREKCRERRSEGHANARKSKTGGEVKS